MSKLKEILNGFANLVWPNPRVEKIAHDRAIICAACDTNVNNFCSIQKGGCGCFIPAKTSSEYSSCPKNFW